jgi:hypothetical protein
VGGKHGDGAMNKEIQKPFLITVYVTDRSLCGGEFRYSVYDTDYEAVYLDAKATYPDAEAIALSINKGVESDNG